MPPKNYNLRKIALVFFAVLFLIAISFALLKFNYKLNSIKKAKIFLKEYKVSKAIEILSKTRASVDKTDKDLDFLIFYSYIKSYEFEKASKILPEIKEIPKDYEEYFYDLISILNIKDESSTLIQVLNKSHHFKLNQNFFIDYSQNRKNPEDELAVLEGGLRYLNTNRTSNSELKEYLLKRYIEITEIHLGKSDAKQALYYLKRADTLGLVKNSAFEDQIYLYKALAYKELKEYETAWDFMNLSAEMGNERAKKSLYEMNNQE
jgi:hypothetical protein